LIERTVHDEEKRFLATLDQGTHMLERELASLPGGGTVPGDVAFRMYDTYGFPIDLTRLMAEEKGFHVDELGFEKHLRQAKDKAKASWKGKTISGDRAFLVSFTQKLGQSHGDTVFTGYETSQEPAVPLLALSDGAREVGELREGQSGLVVTAKTCFYAESGGQVGDKGVLRAPGGEAEVIDTSKQNGIFLHHVRVTDGTLKSGDLLQLVVNSFERRDTANNHSATHLLHAALRKTLGPHVQQAGSLVEADRLRFDFTHGQPLSAAEVETLENLVNAEIAKGIQVHTDVMSQEAAIERGALALFGEKYGDEVRVIRMGDFSMELCGGTHVANTSQIRFFKIVSESGVSAGVRRIEAISGERAAEYLNALSREVLEARARAGLTVNWQRYLEGEGGRLADTIAQNQDTIKGLQREIQALKGKNVDVEALADSAQAFTAGGVNGRFVFADIPMDDRKVLSDLSDRLQDKLKDAVVVIIGQGDGSHPLIVSVSKSLAGRLNAGKILGTVASTLGGKGGGRPDFAQGAVPSRDALARARDQALALVSAT
jgi:alanyl-tRNA synthetase